jgi:hypothetical protein
MVVELRKVVGSRWRCRLCTRKREQQRNPGDKGGLTELCQGECVWRLASGVWSVGDQGSWNPVMCREAASGKTTDLLERILELAGANGMLAAKF